MAGSLAVLLAVLAGCGDKSAETTTVTVQAPATTESSATEPSGETTTEAGSTQTTEDSPGAPAVLASAESTIDGDPARLEVVSLKRSGSVVELTLRLHNLRGDAESGSLQISGAFDDSLSKFNGFDNPGATLDAIYLVDGQNRKKYLVAHDSAGQPLTDANLTATFVEPGLFATLSATLAAPPADVTAVDVFIPSFGTLSGVPIG